MNDVSFEYEIEFLNEDFIPLNDEEIKEEFDLIDIDNNGIITKNEWLLYYIKLLSQNIYSLNNEGPDALMKHIETFSKEFDEYDTNKNGTLNFNNYKDYIKKSIDISL